jgi:hypothetical protein
VSLILLLLLLNGSADSSMLILLLLLPSVLLSFSSHYPLDLVMLISVNGSCRKIVTVSGIPNRLRLSL